MSSGRFFEGAHHMQFYGGQSFANANTIINKYYNYPAARAESEPGLSSCRREDDQWLTLHGGQRLRRIDMCDILILCEISSETHCVSVKLKSTNPFRNRVKNVVKIRKRVQSAEIIEYGDRRFTVVSLEPEDERDVERIQRLLQPLYATALSQRRVWLTQLFGVGRSMMPTLIYHDEVVSGNTIARRYERTPIVWSYLCYRYVNSSDDVLIDGALQKLSNPLSLKFRDWTFNLRTGSFQYDVITSALSDKDEDTHFFTRLPPLPHGCNPPLDSIRAVPDFFRLLSLFRYYTSVRHHDLLTFGTVVDLRKPGILGYFPNITSPVWSCEVRIGIPNVVAKYSNSVPSLVDLAFAKNNNEWKVAIQFSLRLPPEDRQRLPTAFLAQTSTHHPGNPEDLVFVDEISFVLLGTFTSDPSSSDPPKYLHVPPLSPEWIDNMPCIRWPSTRLFFWSFDRSGRMEIPKEDWEKYGIPDLEVNPYFGSTCLPTIMGTPF
ncbi:hypothetical protein E1B28_010584 [Marasmius oreades]|uniref:Uncharacterized protein n=1 Tax=Marasmius oreades TaxID=181124 RepID=A0A9P7RXG4_9AGAR|nr:uncharacterized protein E1B28_010584 [Marasmius oreades]KAG7091556.1 hypothetical protein E1B28_010584 [Marasmius oreades]